MDDGGEDDDGAPEIDGSVRVHTFGPGDDQAKEWEQPPAPPAAGRLAKLPGMAGPVTFVPNAAALHPGMSDRELRIACLDMAVRSVGLDSHAATLAAARAYLDFVGEG